MWGMTKAWDVVDVQRCSQRFTGRREGPPTSFTLFSSKLQVQLMWSYTHDKWHDVSQTLKHSRRGVCTFLQATNQAPPSASLLCIPVLVMSSLLPTKVEEIYIWVILLDFYQYNRSLYMRICPSDQDLGTLVHIFHLLHAAYHFALYFIEILPVTLS